MQDKVTEVQRLGFGKCSLQVQAPEHGSITTVEDLAGKRIVTSFEVLAGEYFNKLDDRLNLVGDHKTKIEYVGGSVEAACALGLADGIGASISFSLHLDAHTGWDVSRPSRCVSTKTYERLSAHLPAR